MQPDLTYLSVRDDAKKSLCVVQEGDKRMGKHNLAETKVKERESECFVLSLSLSFINPC